MVRWVVGSILHGGPIELFLVAARIRSSKGAGYSSVDSVPAFEAVGRRIDPSQWAQLQFVAIFSSNQWSTTGLSKPVVCTVLSMEKCI